MCAYQPFRTFPFSGPVASCTHRLTMLLAAPNRLSVRLVAQGDPQ
jgi:hypothetical protein